MSGRGDYSDEMRNHRHFDDDAIDAIVAGDTSDEVLGPFVDDVAYAASGPAPVPSRLLATMLATGLSTENGDLPARAASNVTGPATQAAGLPKRRKRMPIPQFIAGLSLFGKVALGVGVAAAATGGAGAAGVLPGPVQHAVASSVDAVTPFSFPDKANDHATVGDQTSTDAHDTTTGVDGHQVSDDAKNNPNKPDTPGKPETPGKSDATGPTGASHATGATGPGEHGIGGTVSADAKTGGVDGATVSSEAKAQEHPTGATGPDHATGNAGTKPPTSLPPVSVPTSEPHGGR